MPYLARLKTAFTALKTALPSQCAVCHAWPTQRLCAACLQRFASAPPSVSSDTCGPDLSALDTCHAAVTYGYPWAEIVSAFKFHGDTAWASVLAEVIRRSSANDPNPALWDSAEMIFPIPLSIPRLHQRGFNQALLLAQALAVQQPQKVDPHTLLRLRDTSAQSQLPRAQRLHNLDQAFALHPLRAQRVRGRRVLLVDDILTTGATLDAAAQVLRQAGAAQVSAVVLARTARDQG